jgi:hypothetical protein
MATAEGNLAGERSLSFDSLAADNPPHGRITSKTLGVIHVCITANTPKQRLAELTRHAVPSFLAATAIMENLPGNLGQAENIIKPPISEQPGVRGDLEFQIQAAVKINPKSAPFWVTHRVCHANRSINTPRY